jgi:beta-glucosidase
MYAVESGDYSVWFGSNCEAGAALAKTNIKISGEWKAPLSAVTLLAGCSVLKVGEATGLELSVTLENAVHLNVSELPITVTSSDESVAVVENGRVRAAAPGAVRLTAELTLDGVTRRDSIGICVLA